MLLDSRPRAKISDFGNSRFKDDHNTSHGTVPGTQDYMPPEALGGDAAHNPSLDVFSFGHLSLFTLIKKILRPLLSPSYVDPTSKQYRVRPEVERREQFFKAAQETFSDSHSLLELIKECLHNESLKRPQTKDLVKRLYEVQTSCKLSIILCVNLFSSHFHCAGGVSIVEEPMETEPELDANCADVVRKTGSYR